MAKDWVLVYVLENSQAAPRLKGTTVGLKEAYIELLSYDEVKDLVTYTKPSDNYYAPYIDEPVPADLITQEFLEKLRRAGEALPIRIIATQGIPRSDYNAQKHDSFHLQLGPQFPPWFHDAPEVMRRMGLAANLEYPGSALDVMGRLQNLTRHAPSLPDKNGLYFDHQRFTRVLSEAHPIIWAPHMVKMAQQAILQLEEDVTVENDLLFLDPAFWLYTEPQYLSTGTAEKCEHPLTIDGHIPFPDELALDIGAPCVGHLFHLDNNAISVWVFSLVPRKGIDEWVLEVGLFKLPIGAIVDVAGQNLVKWLRFAASPYLIVMRHGVQRAVTRRAGGRFPVAAEGVGVILLRRAQYQYPSHEHREGEPVDWSCQWWVSGHWRRQWCPGLKKHKPVYIAPYIKGPPDKPLKDTVRLLVR